MNTSSAQRTTLMIVGAALLLAGGIAAGYFLLPKIAGTGTGADGHDHAEGTIYYCPMHPQVEQEGPGVCPICHMDLVPRNSPDAMAAHAAGDDAGEQIRITPRQRVIADVATVEVGYRQLDANIVAPANVQVNEATQRAVTARYPGRIERLYVTKTGEGVRRGAPLAEIYSPELITAQKEYLIALETQEQNLLPGFERTGRSSSAPSGSSANDTRGDRLVRASRERLKLLGMNEGQIEGLEKRGEIAYNTTIFSTASGIVTNRAVVEGAYVNEGTLLLEVVDLSSVWVLANIYESDANAIAPGMRMTVTGPALGGERIEGRVDYIYPSVDPASRTLQVRGVFANPGLRLKPGMYLTATILKPAADALVVPAGAVIRTGLRDLVYVEVEKNTFEAREVKLGMKADGYYQITDGNLNRGDRVVAEGGYLLDSERELGGEREG